jgi:hypothetical protein
LPFVVILSAAKPAFRRQGSLFAFHRNYVLADSVAARAVPTSVALCRLGIAHTIAPSATITGKHSIT